MEQQTQALTVHGSPTIGLYDIYSPYDQGGHGWITGLMWHDIAPTAILPGDWPLAQMDKGSVDYALLHWNAVFCV